MPHFMVLLLQALNQPPLGHLWGVGDKIAVIAIVIGSLQFLALIWTVLVMIWNGRRQLRAYVLPDQAGIYDGTMLTPPDATKANIPGCFLLIKNTGQTPAYAVVSYMQIAVIQVVQESTALGLPAIPGSFYMTLGNGSTFNKAGWFDRPLTPQEIADLAAGTRAVYLYGRIQYTDVFKKKHFSNFRLRYIGQFPPVQGAILNFSESGNDAN